MEPVQPSPETATDSQLRKLQRRLLLGCGVTLLVLAVLVVAGPALLVWWVSDGPWFEREPSPGGRHEVVRETSSFWLDSYTRLWLTDPGVEDRVHWYEIAPEVDGTWDTEWLAEDELLLTKRGSDWYGRELPGGVPFAVTSVRGVRIEQRRSPSCAITDSPDDLHSIDVWTYVDSRGRRSAARLSTNWRNTDPGSIDLLPLGSWQIEAVWHANDQVELVVAPAAGAVVPPVPSRWRELEITVRQP